MVRAFIALGLSREIRESIGEAQQQLRGCYARLAFVDPAQIHITAKFLGEIDLSTLEKVKEALKGISFAPFPVTVGKVTLNNPRRPQTIWCTVEDRGRGTELVALIDRVLTPLGCESETRRFLPHATLARVKSPDPSLFAALKRIGDREFGSCMIAGITLKKSTLTPQGPVYEDLLEVTW
ncbi:RNA 2',3'-cyclic phosphodiesterase [Methanoregula sp.]|jgi:RNA 2',3'-cyclic 3'-phosphodiesterase|uniref:RNA 2',3'-cyclic phosphodiesterase n=1 Tax=Methanoregula sp. TaxID=2052170 RepID=UPI003C13CC8E